MRRFTVRAPGGVRRRHAVVVADEREIVDLTLERVAVEAAEPRHHVVGERGIADLGEGSDDDQLQRIERCGQTPQPRPDLGCESAVLACGHFA